MYYFLGISSFNNMVNMVLPSPFFSGHVLYDCLLFLSLSFLAL